VVGGGWWGVGEGEGVVGDDARACERGGADEVEMRWFGVANGAWGDGAGWLLPWRGADGGASALPLLQRCHTARCNHDTATMRPCEHTDGSAQATLLGAHTEQAGQCRVERGEGAPPLAAGELHPPVESGGQRWRSERSLEEDRADGGADGLWNSEGIAATILTREPAFRCSIRPAGARSCNEKQKAWHARGRSAMQSRAKEAGARIGPVDSGGAPASMFAAPGLCTLA
jgi:hypothetical protein